jgi:hypothetical protein
MCDRLGGYGRERRVCSGDSIGIAEGEYRSVVRGGGDCGGVCPGEGVEWGADEVAGVGLGAINRGRRFGTIGCNVLDQQRQST